MIISRKDYDDMLDTLSRAAITAEDNITNAQTAMQRKASYVVANSIYQALVCVRDLASIVNS